MYGTSTNIIYASYTPRIRSDKTVIATWLMKAECIFLSWERFCLLWIMNKQHPRLHYATRKLYMYYVTGNCLLHPEWSFVNENFGFAINTTATLVFIPYSTVAGWQYDDKRRLIVGIYVSSFDIMETWPIPKALQKKKKNCGGKCASASCECVCCWLLFLVYLAKLHWFTLFKCRYDDDFFFCLRTCATPVFIFNYKVNF